MKINKYWLPLAFASTMALGIYLGNILSKNAGTNTVNPHQSLNRGYYSKIDLVLDLVRENYVDSIEPSKIIEEIIPDVLTRLDPHSMYIPAKDLKEMEEPLEGNFEGIGVQFNITNDTIYIINTIQGGPSEKIGILAGDKIIKINDSLFVGKKVTNDAVIKNLKGERGTKVKVHIKRNGLKELLPFEIVRDKIPIYSITAAHMLNKETGYIKISRFALTTSNEFDEALEKLIKEGMKSLILDLRGNGGGILDAAIKISDHFLDETKLIVYTEGNSRPRINYQATKKGLAEKIKLAILIDTWSASASEIVAGAMQDNDRAVIIGRRSFGKGLVQEPIGFNDGSAIRLTTARYYTPTGRSIQKPYENGVEAYEDEVWHRMVNGELSHSDSIPFPDSIIYTTPKGKILYGGGGIMPDIYVPIDTSYYSPYFQKIVNRGLIYQYALQYTDNQRVNLKKYKDYASLDKYLKQSNWQSAFIKYCEENGVKFDQAGYDISQSEISLRFRAYTIRNIFDENEFYQTFNQSDPIINKALDALFTM